MRLLSLLLWVAQVYITLVVQNYYICIPLSFPCCFGTIYFYYFLSFGIFSFVSCMNCTVMYDYCMLFGEADMLSCFICPQIYFSELYKVQSCIFYAIWDACRNMHIAVKPIFIFVYIWLLSLCLVLSLSIVTRSALFIIY